MITISEEIAVPSPRARVWEVVSSPSDVVSCISGAELGAAHDDGSFDGALVVRFGALRVRFAARISLTLNESEFEGRLSARGGDGQGATRFHGGATFHVLEDAGGTRVLMTGELTLSGKLAALVESGAGAVVSRMTKDFSAKLVEKCAGPVASPPSRPSWPRRFRAWLRRVLRRARPSTVVPSPRTTTEEVGSGNAPTQ